MKRESTSVRIGVTVLCVLGGVACGGGPKKPGHKLPWQAPRAQVISSDRSALSVPAPDGDACLDYAGDDCIKPQEECGDDISSDVILDRDGHVLEVVCYPDGRELTLSEVQAQDGEIAQNQNKSVIHVGVGETLDGNLSIDANKVLVYGDDPATSTIAGDLTIDGNNVIVHGVRIQGDVQILSNSAFLVHCVIEGNLTVSKNNTVVSGCDVLGTTTVLGNNTALTGNYLVGPLELAGKHVECAGNFSAEDANEDGVLDETELGDPVSCGG